MKYMSDFIIYLYTMDKLIELVYYYNFEVKTFEVWIWLPDSDTDYYWWTIDKEKEIRKYKLMIISKEYGFIEWLYKNDKLNLYKWKYLENPIWSNNYDECDYLELIQWLAISDTPIEDLVYYLK